MSTLAKELKVKISADANGLKGALNNISKEISKVSKDFEGLKKVGEGISSVGKKLTVGLSLPIAGIGAVSGKTAMDFEAGMNKVSAISGATGKDLEKLENLAKEMGRTTKFTSLESAEALSYMGMAGWKTQDMLNGLPGILSLASAGGTDLALTSDIVTDGLTAMGLTAKDTDKFVDIMASTVSNANTSIELMGETLAYVGPVAGSLGIEMDDLSVAIGLMGNAGLKGSQAGTSLRAGLTNLVKPTKEMKNAMEKYGVELVKNADGSVDLMGTMQNLRNVLGELDQTTQAQALATIFGKEAMSGWASIVNASESDFNKLTEAIANSEGSAKSMADTMMGGAKGALTEMKSALEGVAITIGERLTPFIEKLADGVSKLCTWFQSLSPATQTFLMVVAGLMALLGPLLLLIGSTVSLFANLSIVAGALGISIGALCAPFLIVVGVIAGVIAIGYLLVSNWDWICEKASELGRIVGDAWNSMCEWISEACSNIGEWISDTWNNIYTWTSETWNSICDWISNAWDTICNLVTVGVMLIGEILSAGFEIITLPWQFIWENCKDIIIPIWETIKEFISEKLEQIKEFISTVWENIKTVTSTIWEAVKTVISTIWEGIKAVISTIVNWIKENIISRFNEAKNKVTEVINSMKESISNKFNEIKTNVTNKVNEIKTNITNKFNEAKSKAIEIFTNIKTGIEDKINGAKDVVKKGIDKIKGFFDFEWSLPKIKLPHFSISGGFSLNPPKAPSFKVDWYSKGAIFKRPTVLGGIGVGDSHNGIGSGAEAILPIKELPKLLGLDKMQNGGVTLSIENFNNNTDKDIEYLANELAFYLSRKKIGMGGAF